MNQRSVPHATWLITTIAALSGCQHGSSGTQAEPSSAAIEVTCAAGGSNGATDAWVCPRSFTVACEDIAITPFLVKAPASTTCGVTPVKLAPTQLTVGTHTLELTDTAGETLCSSEVTVTASSPAIVEPRVVQLWPPNHKLHEISISDCVDIQDSCGGPVTAEFIWASSDEPVDDIGDGHHAPDIALAADCQHVSVRSERQGPKDGRVYKLGVRVIDAAGSSTEVVCHVIVDHDQRGVVGADSGEAYRIDFAGTQGGPVCDGTQPPDPVPPPPTQTVPALPD